MTLIQMSKGLKFDEVIVLDVENESYIIEYDKNQLYIAAAQIHWKFFFIPITVIKSSSLNCHFQ
ncbi:hypothetical protein H7U28_16055 [Coprobacillus cateniformis]|nr:hypothetical protein [Coprobacillus cateniformis]